MKKIKLSLIKSGKIKVLTMPSSWLRLNKCSKNEYAVTTQNYRVLHAFESRSLSALFAKEGRRKLRWIRVIERSIRHGPGPKRLIELHFQFQDGRKYILDERDRLFSLTEVPIKERLHSPCGVWGLVPKVPIVHLLLTAGMVDLIETLAQDDQIEHVVRTFWQDWTLAQAQGSDPMALVKIQGEFGPFKANRINSKMVKFDT